MKKLLPFVLMTIFLAGCKSSEKLLQQGDYDQAINKSFKKVVSNPSDSKQISILRKSLKLANQQDLDAIKQLQNDGNPASEPIIYKHYLSLDQRQNLIQRLPDQVLRHIGFKHTDFNSAISHSKKAAALYYHNEAVNLLETHDIYNARKAYYLLQSEASLTPGAPGLSEMIKEARDAGTIHVIFEVQNSSGQEIPPAITEKLYQMNPNVIDRNWTLFDTYPVKNRSYQYFVKLDINMIQVSPQQINRNTFEEKKKIADGWQYVLDRRGNVKKDSAGNDIKIPKYKIIRCQVTQVTLVQESSVISTIGIYNNATGRPVKVQNMQSHFVFNYRYGKARGNLKALDKQSLEMVSRGPMPFPDYPQLLIENLRVLKEKTEYFLRTNRNLFQ
ncbi:MAG: hypothetical protein JXR65_08905 [Bacteroidales bacterium]|nr:hypothetical protein [Bacteroidales bacterium]